MRIQYFASFRLLVHVFCRNLSCIFFSPPVLITLTSYVMHNGVLSSELVDLFITHTTHVFNKPLLTHVYYLFTPVHCILISLTSYVMLRDSTGYTARYLPPSAPKILFIWTASARQTILLSGRCVGTSCLKYRSESPHICSCFTFHD